MKVKLIETGQGCILAAFAQQATALVQALAGKTLLTVVLLLLTSWSSARDLRSASPQSVDMDKGRLERITEMTQRYVDEGKMAGVITMVNRGGKLVHFEAVGAKGLIDKRPLAKDDLFRIYSMTKPITAVAAMQLYEQGKFHLNDPVSKFVPELSDLMVWDDGELVPVEHEPTMHELLTHTAGFSYGFNPQDPVDVMYREANLWGARDLTHLAEKLAELPLRYQPGTRWHYSVAVDITGLVVERISGKRFDVYLEEEIFEPLGMSDTFFEVPPEKLPRFLANHFWDVKANTMKDVRDATEGLLGASIEDEDNAMVNYEKVTLYSGGGGLVSTAMDYMKFAEMLRAGGAYNGARIISPKTLKYMAMNHLPSTISASGGGEDPFNSRFSGIGFGLGFGVITDPVAMGTIASKGEYNWGGAAGTVFWIDPVEDLAVVGMIQLMSSPWTFREDLRVATYQALEESME